MTKNEAKALAKQYGCEASYSGKERIMFVKGRYAISAARYIRNSNPAFRVHWFQTLKAY